MRFVSYYTLILSCICPKPLRLAQTFPLTLWLTSGLGNQSKLPFFPPAYFWPIRKDFQCSQKPISGLYSASSRWATFACSLFLKFTIFSFTSFWVTVVAWVSVYIYWDESPQWKGLPHLSAVPRIPQSEPASTQRLWAVCQGIRGLPAVTITGVCVFMYTHEQTGLLSQSTIILSYKYISF